MVRHDVHAPAAEAFDPALYTFFGAFDTHPEEGDRKYMAMAVNALVEKGYKSGPGGCGQCGHCGAFLRYNALLAREDVKEFIFVGETCLDNRFSLSKPEFALLRKRAAEKAAKTRALEAVHTFCETNPVAVWLTYPQFREHSDFYQSLWGYFRKNGALTEKQMAALERSMVKTDERRTQRREAEAVKAAALAAGAAVPVGKVTVTGVVKSTKWVESMYGTTRKMLVELADGCRVWGSVPKALSDVSDGDAVTFNATVEASKDDALFGFFKRPTQAKYATA